MQNGYPLILSDMILYQFIANSYLGMSISSTLIVVGMGHDSNSYSDSANVAPAEPADS